jgi:hypothetical protein
MSLRAQAQEESQKIGALGLVLRRLQDEDGTVRFRVMTVCPGRLASLAWSLFFPVFQAALLVDLVCISRHSLLTSCVSRVIALLHVDDSKCLVMYAEPIFSQNVMCLQVL